MLRSPTGSTGHVQDPHHFCARIGMAGETRFRFHGLRGSFITLVEREPMLPPRSLVKRLVNHARPTDVTQAYAADWTISPAALPLRPQIAIPSRESRYALDFVGISDPTL